MAGLENPGLWLGGLMALKKDTPALRVAIVGGGWAGCSAAVAAIELGWQVDLFEAAPAAGGRAKSLTKATTHPHNDPPLDNGQHILLGAYSACLATLKTISVNADAVFMRSALDLRDKNAAGFALPNWASTATSEVGMASAVTWAVVRCRRWPIRARVELLTRMLRWRLSGFTCHSSATVADICTGLHSSVMRDFIEPLCVSALNIAPNSASGSVWLRVLKDALLSEPGSSDMLLAKCDLSTLFVEPCLTWLKQQGGRVHTGARVTQVMRKSGKWHVTLAASEACTQPTHADVQATPYNHVIIATPAAQASAICWIHNPHWAQAAASLEHTAIATVYAHSKEVMPPWRSPMIALTGGLAQFVFNRSDLMAPTQTCQVAAVVSDSAANSRDDITASVMQQLDKTWPHARWEWLQTVVEKRACFACTPHAARPVMRIAANLWACADYIAGPYPSTLEGAVRSGREVMQAIGQAS